MKGALTSTSVKKDGASRWHNTLVYMRQHWQLYLFFMLPAVLLTVIFRYIPMGGVLIAFTEYNPIRGILGSEWVGFSHFRRFLSSPDFMRYLMNTLKLSLFGLLWGFPAPILLAFLLNRVLSSGIKQKIQLVLYMPNFISVIVLCGIVRILLSPTGMVNMLLGTSYNFMTMPEAFRTIYIASGIWQGCGLGFHHLHRGSVQRQQGTERSGSSGRCQHHPADQGCGMARDQRYGADPVHYERGQYYVRGF